MLTAITGGIAEGKSTVLGYLASLGHPSISADEVGRALFDDPSINSELARIAGVPSPIDRPTLRERLVTDPQVRRAVNRTMHPRIMEAIAASGAQFVEVPLLFETCLQGAFESIWVVTCGTVEQRRRLHARYGPEFDIDSILSTQLPTKAKLAFADVVIRTNRPEQDVKNSVSKAIESR